MPASPTSTSVPHEAVACVAAITSSIAARSAVRPTRRPIRVLTGRALIRRGLTEPPRHGAQASSSHRAWQPRAPRWDGVAASATDVRSEMIEVGDLLRRESELGGRRLRSPRGAPPIRCRESAGSTGERAEQPGEHDLARRGTVIDPAIPLQDWVGELPAAAAERGPGEGTPALPVSQRSRIASELRSVWPVPGLRPSIGCDPEGTASVGPSLTLQTPMWRIWPSSLSRTSMPQPSPRSGPAGSTPGGTGTPGSAPVVTAAGSRRRRRGRCCGRPSGLHWFGPLRVSPPFVAMTKSSGYGYSASVIRCSLTNGPYESAVSMRLTPSSTANARGSRMVSS